MKHNIGITEQHRASISEALAKVLAGSYSLQLQTQYCHWNVKGPFFDPLHKLFQAQYEEIQVAVDEIAERIRALGHVAPGSFDEFAKLSPIKQRVDFRNADEMLVCLLEAHEHMVLTCKEAIHVAGKGGDEATEDLLTERVEIHGKTAWMLRATLEK
jgi:starvation-inducible DNA-binding protein